MSWYSSGEVVQTMCHMEWLKKKAKERENQLKTLRPWKFWPPPSHVGGFCARHIGLDWLQHKILEHLVETLQAFYSCNRREENCLYLRVSLANFGEELLKEGRVTSQKCCPTFEHACLCHFGTFLPKSFKQPLWWILREVVDTLLVCRRLCLLRGRPIEPLVAFVNRHGANLLVAPKAR